MNNLTTQLGLAAPEARRPPVSRSQLAQAEQQYLPGRSRRCIGEKSAAVKTAIYLRWALRAVAARKRALGRDCWGNENRRISADYATQTRDCRLIMAGWGADKGMDICRITWRAGWGTVEGGRLETRELARTGRLGLVKIPGCFVELV
jgi:hypothetical protein